MSKFITTTLEKICLGEKKSIISGPFGSNISSKFFLKEGVPVIRGNNLSLSYDKFIEKDFAFISKEKADELNCYAYRNDIIFTIAGTIGQVGIIPTDSIFKEYVISNKQARVRINEKIVDHLYVYYWLSSPLIQNRLKNSNKGSTVPLLTLGEIKDIPIMYPISINIQKKISTFLENLSKKIELNNKINDNLEQQVKTIFSFRFLQNAKTEWKQQSLAELAEMYQPKTISGKDLIVDGKYFVYGANGVIGKYNQYNHTDSEIAIACRGASCGSIQMTLPFSWITGNAMVLRPYSDFPYREYLYYYLLAKNPNYLCSGSAQPQLTRENLTLYTLKVPSKTELDAFEKYAKQARKIIIKNQQEIVELLTLREWLLPMLVNGQATISD